MHEMSIAQSLIGILQDEMAKNGVTILTKVQVKYGALSGVVPEALAFAFEVLTKETDMADAELVLEEVPLKLRCSECAKEFVSEERGLILIPCPYCGEDIGHEVLEGKELYIERIVAE